MANEPANQLKLEGSRDALKSYNLALPMGSLSIGVDNIHHDVFLSPKFVQVARDYLFDLIRQNTSGTYLSGIELRNAKAVDSTPFRKMLLELMQGSLAKAKLQFPLMTEKFANGGVPPNGTLFSLMISPMRSLSWPTV